jgi:hypothetical protein
VPEAAPAARIECPLARLRAHQRTLEFFSNVEA